MTGPYSTYSANVVTIADYMVSKVEDNKTTFTTPVAAVYYGDQDKIPVTPTVCIEPSDVVRDLVGAPNMTDNMIEVFVLIYHNKVQDNQLTRREVDQLGYEIAQLFHQDLQFVVGTSPLLIHGFFMRNESGYVFKNGTLYRTVRMTFRGRNKTSLPVS